jgi:hypothetical protein
MRGPQLWRKIHSSAMARQSFVETLITSSKLFSWTVNPEHRNRAMAGEAERIAKVVQRCH